MQFLNISSAAKVADCHRQTIGDALRSGELHGFHAAKNKHWRIDEGCLRAWLEGSECWHRVKMSEQVAESDTLAPRRTPLVTGVAA